MLMAASQSRKGLASNRVLDLKLDFDAIPDDHSSEALRYNTLVLESALNSLEAFETLIVGQNFFLYHGVNATDMKDVVIQIDGSLNFERDFSESWNENSYQVGASLIRPKPCITLTRGKNITFTSTTLGRGIIHGGGPQWWGVPFIGYQMLREHRPRLFYAHRTIGLVIENMIFQDSPFHSLYLYSINQVVIHHVSIVSRRTTRDAHGLIDLSAFNTDGIDVAGHNVHIHDVDIWNQDDCIAVKDNDPNFDLLSSNMTFERINASGLGFVIGSIGTSTVRNITFRDSYLYKSYKGIYLKFREQSTSNQSGIIEDILFENITIESPQQWAIWIGPAQQAGGRSRDPCYPSPCSLCWPTTPGAECNAVKHARYRNITLKNIMIYNPLGTGVILGHEDITIEDVVFDNVLILTTEHNSSIDRYSSFPGLRQPVHDPYVKYGFIIVALMVGFLAAVTRLCCLAVSSWSSRATGCCFRCRNYNELEQEDCTPEGQNEQVVHSVSPKACTRRVARRMTILSMVVALVISFGVLTSLHASVARRTSDASKYFVCSGVANGVAQGKTFPIPYCFEDKTTR